MKPLCPSCHQAVAPADINIQAMTALCRGCGEIFSLTPAAAAAADDRPLPIPARFLLASDSTRALDVSWRWWRAQHVGLLLFCIAWDAFIIFWYSVAIFGPHKSGGMDLIAVIFPIGHVAVGVGLTYFLIAAALNRTTVACDGDTLTIRHAPVPWAGNRQLPLRDLSDFRTSQVTTRNTNTDNNLTTANTTWTLSATRDGRDLKLLGGLADLEANWLRQKLANLRSPP
jgi:hypothetical protein